jgi:ABC-type nitrate/sulfonate/bicarbonate transport system substrate-binding protein
MKNKNQLLLLVATFVLFLTLSVSHAAETFTLGYTNLRGAKVPVPLGVEEGIFTRHGIELKMAPVSPGTEKKPRRYRPPRL